jgi:hypothetical protein
MAAPDVTKKLLIYHTLYRLNLSFSNIVTRCRELHDTGVLRAHSTRLFRDIPKNYKLRSIRNCLRRCIAKN